MLRLFRHYIPFPALSLAFLETVLFFFLLDGLIKLRSFLWSGNFTSESTDTGLLALITGVAFLTMSSVGMYNREVFFQFQSMMYRSAITIPILFVVISTFLYIFATITRIETHSYYVICLISVIIFFPLILMLRGIFIEVVSLDIFKRRVLVLGAGPLAAKIHMLGGESHRGHFIIIGFASLDEQETCEELSPVLPRDLLDRRHALATFAHENQIDEIVVASGERRGLPVRYLLECKLGGVLITDFPTFWERESGEVDLESLHPSWLIFSDGFKFSWFRQLVKRSFDVVVSAAFLLFTIPVTLTTALLIKLDSPGPVFYRQERVGQNGRRFNVLKFRSMRADAEGDGVPRWAGAEDDRITPFGQFIRKTRIDEIPQVVNVLKGDMSFVGPRPERPFFVGSLSATIPFYYQRHGVKPGITGWAQINYPYGASEGDAKAKLAFDLYYVKNGSLFLDFLILVQTVRVVLWSAGAR